MKLVAPDYFSEFECIKGACRHSCCIGWEIDIDADSLKMYMNTPGEMGRRLREGIKMDAETACFRMKDDGRCPFLNAGGLCDLIIEMGEDSLCQICDDHPRFRNFFSDRTEAGLGLCCEAAARLILTRNAPARLIDMEDDGENEIMDDDEKYVTETRDELIGIAQDRSLPVPMRIERILEASEIEIFQPDMARWAKFLLELERLDEEWATRLGDIAGETGAKLTQCPEIALEQLMVYLLYRHLPGALDDGDMPGRIVFAVLMWRVVGEIGARAGGGMDEIVEAARLFSSEIEYSDENICAILDEIHRIYPDI